MEIDIVDALTSLVLGFLGNLASVTVVAGCIYHMASKRRDFVFTFLLVSSAVYLLSSLLSGLEIEMGFALGLFAIFGIIRYRTDAIPIREMTYLFITISLAVVNALAYPAINVATIVVANVFVWILTFILERVWLIRHLATKMIVYDRIDLIADGRRDELKADLEARTGIKIHNIEIGKIDLLRDTAIIKVHFFGDEQPNHFEGGSTER